MKFLTVLLTFVVLFTGFELAAYQQYEHARPEENRKIIDLINPSADQVAIKTCQRSSGKVVLLKDKQQARSFQFCFFQSAAMEVQTFKDSILNEFGRPEANQAYRQTINHDMMACQRFGGRSVFTENETGRFFPICVFSDRSAILDDTLQQGIQSPWNQSLNRALGIIWP